MAEWPGTPVETKAPVENQWPGQAVGQTTVKTIDVEKLTDPHEIEFVQARRGQLTTDEMQEAIRQYRAISRADQEKPITHEPSTPKTTQLPKVNEAGKKLGLPQEDYRGMSIPPAPVTPNAVYQSYRPDWGKILEPPSAGPTISATPPYGEEWKWKKLGSILSGAYQEIAAPFATTRDYLAGALTGVPGQPRTPHELGNVTGGEDPGSFSSPPSTDWGKNVIPAIVETATEAVGDPLMLSGIPGLRLAGRSGQAKRILPNQGGAPTILSGPEEALYPQGLYSSAPRGGAYSTEELLTEPQSRISGGPYGEGQFTTGSGEPLFGEMTQPHPEAIQPLPSTPVTIPPPQQAWAQEAVVTGRLQEKLPTIEQGPLPKKAPLLDMGSPSPDKKSWIPPQDYRQPPTPSKWKQAWNVEKQRWGQELPVLKTQPQSPVISAMESTHVAIEDFMENYVRQPWLKNAFKLGDNDAMAPLEAKWVQLYKDGQDWKGAMPEDMRRLIERRDELFAEENAIRRRRGLPEIPTVQGPYLPRITDEDFKLMRTLTRHTEGAKTAQSVGPFAMERKMETMLEGMDPKAGITYKDWRWAALLREARGAALRATDVMMTDLEKAGVIFRDRAGAEAVSLDGKAYQAHGLPFSPKDGWWVRSTEERQFLLQNLRTMDSGTLANIRGWAQQFVRNPSLVNPWPHIVKNMGLKQMQQAVVSGLRPDHVLKNTIQHRMGKADMLEEFNTVMPFTESGRTVWEIMEKAGPKDTVQQLSRVPGLLNTYARGKIFAEWDPAMRYGLWREYVKKGMTPQEAANHTWIDLIRYGTRADRIDAWNSVPFNFFVPWRVGTLRTVNKAFQTAPVKMGLFMGAVDTIREMDYRYNGRWTHLPYDYIERPLMTLMTEGKEEALTSLAATLIAGPGGEYMFNTVRGMIDVIESKGGVGELRALGWGMAQVLDVIPQYESWKRGENPNYLTDTLGLLLLGRHGTPYGAPHRFGEMIPESLIKTHPEVQAREQLRPIMKDRDKAKQDQKWYRDVERTKQPFQPQIPPNTR